MKGICLEGKKEATLLVWTLRRFDPPKTVRLPLSWGEGLQAKPAVEIGQHVQAGEVIAQPAHANAVAICATISGNITAIDPFLEIQSQAADEKNIPAWNQKREWENFSKVQLLNIFQQSGLVDLESEMVPVHVKAARPVSTLVLNACEPEPYQTCDHALLMSHPLEILKGIEILFRVLDASKIKIITQDNKWEVAETLKSKIFLLKWPHAEVEIIPSIYPHGKEVMLRRRLSKISQETFEIFNIATAFTVYEAVVCQKPLIERVVTIGGECIIEPKNAWVRLGTDLESMVKMGRSFLRPPRKLILGGPMQGIAQKNLDFPLIPGAGALIALPEELAKPETVNPCIRCGACVDACPVDIHPAMITMAADQDLFSIARDFGAGSCIECGNCSYVCPSKRPMVELIRYTFTSKPKSDNHKNSVTVTSLISDSHRLPVRQAGHGDSHSMPQ